MAENGKIQVTKDEKAEFEFTVLLRTNLYRHQIDRGAGRRPHADMDESGCASAGPCVLQEALQQAKAAAPPVLAVPLLQVHEGNDLEKIRRQVDVQEQARWRQ